MKISYAICTHNEGQLVRPLKDTLSSIKSTTGIEREVVILDDMSDDVETKKILDEWAQNGATIHTKKLGTSFAEHKNHLNSLCTGDWILNLDADETVSHDFLHLVDKMITSESRQDIDAYGIPRINVVNRITREHLRKWRWQLTKIEHKLLERRIYTNILKNDAELTAILNENKCIIEVDDTSTHFYVPVIAWPDYQLRLYRNNKIIQWTRAVHEVLTGYQVLALFPESPDYAIQHIKDIRRQETQNKLYEGFSS